MAADSVTQYFEALAARGREPLLRSSSGTIRFDVGSGSRVEQWLVTIKKGELSVARDGTSADAIVHVDAAGFEGLTKGRINAVTAILRGELAVEGDLGLLMSFQRLFPSPPKSVYARRIK
jgi:putative sterol carrier protein